VFDTECCFSNGFILVFITKFWWTLLCIPLCVGLSCRNLYFHI